MLEEHMLDGWSPGCLEYFRAFADGRFDEGAQHWFIYPRPEVWVDSDRRAFVVGDAGADGIEFCFRKGQEGVWAYYPIGQEWMLKAASLAELERGWQDGSICV